MSKRYFKKELPEAAVYIAGHPFKFDIYETEDPLMIAQLDACIARGVGGIIGLSAEEYAVEAQKKTSGISYGSSFKANPQAQRSNELSAVRALRAAAAGVDDGARVSRVPLSAGDSPVTGRPKPDPISVPSPNQFSGLFVRPPTAKSSALKAAAEPPDK